MEHAWQTEAEADRSEQWNADIVTLTDEEVEAQEAAAWAAIYAESDAVAFHAAQEARCECERCQWLDAQEAAHLQAA